MDEPPYQNFGSVIKSQCMEEKKKEQMCNAKEELINILSYVDFQNCAM